VTGVLGGSVVGIVIHDVENSVRVGVEVVIVVGMLLVVGNKVVVVPPGTVDVVVDRVVDVQGLAWGLGSKHIVEVIVVVEGGRVMVLTKEVVKGVSVDTVNVENCVSVGIVTHVDMLETELKRRK